MRHRHLWLFLLGAALGGGAVFYVLTEQRTNYFPHAVAGPENVRVLVAKQPLVYGASIQPGHLQWVEWPKAAVPPGVFTSAEALLGDKGDQRRIVLRAIEAGEPILESKITKFGESPRMAMNLSAGMRAVSIRIDAASGVSDFIAPGDRVDILLTRSLDGQLVSSVILQGITVIAVDQSSNTEAASPRLGRTVTVEVDTVQAQKLALAQQVGDLSLTLRGTSAPGGGNLLPPDAFPPDRKPEILWRIAPRDGSSGYDDRPVHPILQPPPEAIVDPAHDWTPGADWPRLPREGR